MRGSVTGNSHQRRTGESEWVKCAPKHDANVFIVSAKISRCRRKHFRALLSGHMAKKVPLDYAHAAPTPQNHDRMTYQIYLVSIFIMHFYVVWSFYYTKSHRIVRLGQWLVWHYSTIERERIELLDYQDLTFCLGLLAFQEFPISKKWLNQMGIVDWNWMGWIIDTSWEVILQIIKLVHKAIILRLSKMICNTTLTDQIASSYPPKLQNTSHYLRSARASTKWSLFGDKGIFMMGSTLVAFLQLYFYREWTRSIFYQPHTCGLSMDVRSRSLSCNKSW